MNVESYWQTDAGVNYETVMGPTVLFVRDETRAKRFDFSLKP